MSSPLLPSRFSNPKVFLVPDESLMVLGSGEVTGPAGAHAADRLAEEEAAGAPDAAADLPAALQEAGDQGGLPEGDGVRL